MNVKLIKIIVVLLIAMLFTAGAVGAEGDGNGNDPNLINDVSFEIKEPVTDESPQLTYNIDEKEYTIEVSWDPKLDEDSKFSPNKVYTATFTITAKEGYCFSENINLKIKYIKSENEYNEETKQSKVSDNKETFTITHKFEQTKKKNIPLLNIIISDPVAGGEAVSIIPNDECEIHVDWNPSCGKFSPGIAYNATFKITPKEGYNFTSKPTVTINSIEISNNNVTLNENRLTTFYQFSKIGEQEIDSVDIIIKPPKSGDALKDAEQGENYTVITSWKTADKVFLPNTVYNATFNLTAKEGYYFKEGTSVNIYGNSDCSIITKDFSKENNKLLNITYKFGKTGTQTIDTIKISDLKLPEVGDKPDEDVVIVTTGINKSEVNWNTTKFEFGKTYMVTINLTANKEEGYKFADSAVLKVLINGEEVESSGITVIDEKKICIRNNYTVPESNLPKLNVIADVEKGKVPLKVTFSYNTTNATKLTVNFEGKEEDIDKDGIVCGNKSHKFIKNGKYDVFFNATNKDGTTTKKITITVYNIKTSFKASPTSGTVPLTVTFTDTTDKSIEIYSSLWDFGDESTEKSGKCVEHTFEKPDVYTVTHTVTDYNGNTASSTKTITVNQIESPLSEADDKSKNSGTQNGEPLLKLDASFPQPLGIIQELVKLFLSLFDLSTYGIE